MPRVRHGRARPGHPRLFFAAKTWMPGTRPGMTSSEAGSDYIIFLYKPARVEAKGRELLGFPLVMNSG
ncbi:hypothetical protein XI02_07700 [Bradyrhizobium sp. CCBAU 21365]|nr:hypothetical protein XI02_07700 [Bradyrhizobium sp. CCBAU 21365]